MIIRDLEVLEVVAQDETVEGGIAFADAGASSYASGSYFAATSTSTYTSAYSSPYYYYYYGSSASSGSSSSAVAY
jgi:hypothetical protein